MLCMDLTLLSFMVMNVLDKIFHSLESALKGFCFVAASAGISHSLSLARYSISRGI